MAVAPAFIHFLSLVLVVLGVQSPTHASGSIPASGASAPASYSWEAVLRSSRDRHACLSMRLGVARETVNRDWSHIRQVAQQHK